MENEKLLVSQTAVEQLRKMAYKWANQNDDYTNGVGVGIRFALISLGLNEEATI